MSTLPADVRPGYLLPPRATTLACVGLMVSLFLVALNQTIVATAVPSIVDDLGGLNLYSWVFTAYILGSTVTVPLFGRLSDVHGRRPFFVAGLVLLVIGSLGGAAAASIGELIAARAVQGLGGGALLALAFTSLGDLVPPSDRGRWQAVNGAVFSAASVLGPLAGGAIADHASWRWVFLATVPLGVFALVLGGATLRIPPHPERARSVDYLGAVLLMGSLAGLMLATVEWGDHGSLGDADVGLPLLAGVALATAFARHELRVDDPFLPLELLRDRVVRLVCLIGLLTGATHFGSITFVPLFAQDALGASATGAGLVLMPLMVGIFGASMVSGPAITRSGRYRWVILGAPPAIGAGFALIALMGPGTPIALAAAVTALLGLGLGLVAQNLVLVAQNSAPSRHLGAATSVVTLCRNAGGALGVSVMGALLSTGLGNAGAPTALTGTASGVSGETLADAFRLVFLSATALMVLTLAVTLRLPDRPLRRTVRGDGDDGVARCEPLHEAEAR